MRGGSSSPMLILLGPCLQLQQPTNGQASSPRVSEGQGQLSIALGWQSRPCSHPQSSAWPFFGNTGSRHQHRPALWQDHIPRHGPQQQHRPGYHIGSGDNLDHGHLPDLLWSHRLQTSTKTLAVVGSHTQTWPSATTWVRMSPGLRCQHRPHRSVWPQQQVDPQTSTWPQEATRDHGHLYGLRW